MNVDQSLSSLEGTAGGPAQAPRRWLTVWVVNVTHGLNHTTSSAMNALYPVLRDEFGFGYIGIAMLSVINQLVEGPMQATFGVLTRFFRRVHILGVGTILTFLGVLLVAISQTYAHLVLAKIVRGFGASPNHPVGGAIMAYSFPKDRAKALAAHTTSGNIGGWLAPLLIGGMLYLMDWRLAVLLIAIPFGLMGFVLLLLKEPAPPKDTGASTGRRRRSLGLTEYKTLMRDRNSVLLASVMAVGAAGRGTGALNTYLAVILVDRFGITPALAAFFLAAYVAGGVVGPMTMGWLADRVTPRFAIRIDLVMSAFFSVLILVPQTAGPLLALFVFLAGFFIFARSSLVQAALVDMAPKSTRVDTQLSMFHTFSAVVGPLWILASGLIVATFGINVLLITMACSYLLGMVLLGFMKRPTEDKVAASSL